ncbi:PP2C family protein-serine/threonine phosphatase [Streptomyces avicenniae]|uniref:PP2C family protein-serine/threonine phosphatase n=1 Tax=Streptomyces avicenniae TaxID=500153 RepID=UPI000699DF78|nr:PP2C family protein-serine/threonine phosphatase [Streptomyces avicenniae]
MTDPGQVAGMLGGLMQTSQTATLEQLPALVAEHAAEAGLRQVVLFVADLQDVVLRQLTGRGPNAGEGGTELPVEGTLPGRAFQRGELLREAGGNSDDEPNRWWLPVTDGVERLGVMRADSAADDGPTRDAMRALASLVALLLLSKRSFSDSYARLTRTAPMNVAAELQWNLMPPPAYTGHQVTVGAVLEPAYSVGGDAFDYAVAGSMLHLSIFDAMGHDATAGLTANLAVAAARNARRHGTPLSHISQAVEDILVGQFGTSRYATGIFADLDMTTGELSWVNRGHHPPLLIRGGRWTLPLSCPPAGPMGAMLGLPVQVCREQLEPGDGLLLYTDGIVEARDANGDEFGTDRFADAVLRHHSGQHTLHETLRRLMRAVLDHHRGTLADDATVLLAEWRGGPEDVPAP